MSQVHHAQVGAGDHVGHALPRFELRALGGGQGVPLGLPGADGVRSVGLGEAVDVARSRRRSLRRRGSPRAEAARPRSRCAAAARTSTAVRGAVLRQRADHHRRAAEVRDAFGLDEPHDLAPDRAGAGRCGARRPPSPPRRSTSRCSGTAAASRGRRCAGSGRARSISPIALTQAPRWVNITPLGNPVVPLV